MWLTYRGRCHTSRLAARQNGESVAAGEGQGKKIPGKQTQDVIYKQDSPWDAISRTAIREEMSFFSLGANICSVRHRRRRRRITPAYTCECACSESSSVRRSQRRSLLLPECKVLVDVWRVTCPTCDLWLFICHILSGLFISSADCFCSGSAAVRDKFPERTTERIVSSHLVSYRLVSCRLVSYRIVSSRLISSHIVSSCLVSSHIMLSGLISYRLVSSRLISCCLVSYHIISYCLVSSRLVSSHIISSRLISYCLVSYRLVSPHLVSYRVVSYRLVPYRFLQDSVRGVP